MQRTGGLVLLAVGSHGGRRGGSLGCARDGAQAGARCPGFGKGRGAIGPEQGLLPLVIKDTIWVAGRLCGESMAQNRTDRTKKCHTSQQVTISVSVPLGSAGLWSCQSSQHQAVSQVRGHRREASQDACEALGCGELWCRVTVRV